MQALVCEQFGPLDQLTVLEVPDPMCGPNQIRIEVAAAGVNFVDALFVQGRYQIKPPTPFIAGSEIAGVVAEVGNEVTGWVTGDRVMASIGLGGFADQIVARPEQLHRVPDELDLATAATFTQSYCTAQFALHHRTSVRAGDRVLVLGAGGGVGLACIDVARAAGADVIAVASTPDKRDAALAQGASHVIDSADDVKTLVRELTGGGADIAVDPVGGELSTTALRSLGEGGRLLIIGFASGIIADLPANQILLRNRTVIGVDWGIWAMSNGADQRALLDELLGEVERGELHPIAPTQVALTAATQALADLENRRVVGKVALMLGVR